MQRVLSVVMLPLVSKLQSIRQTFDQECEKSRAAQSAV